MRPRLAATLAALLAAWAALPPAAHAGSVEGPYIVWMNLARAPQPADQAIQAFVDADRSLCWNDQALLYMRQRPAAITPELVRRAVLQRQGAAQRRLRALMKQPFGEVPGFDGVMVYTDQPQPRIASLGWRGPVQAEDVRSPTGELAWGATFCRLLPPIVRGP
jgi:hypothetical protein